MINRGRIETLPGPGHFGGDWNITRGHYGGIETLPGGITGGLKHYQGALRGGLKHCRGGGIETALRGD